MTRDEMKDFNDLLVVVARLDTKLQVLLPTLATKADFGKLAGAFTQHCEQHSGFSRKQIGIFMATVIPVLTALTAYFSSLIVG